MANEPQKTQPKIAEAPDPYADPVAYLKAHGRQPLGNPEWPDCLWIDTTKPLFATETREPKMTPFLEPDPDNPKQGRWVIRQQTQRIANAAGHASEVPVFQHVYTPDQQPLNLQQALMQVMEAEHRKKLEAKRPKAAAATAA